MEEKEIERGVISEEALDDIAGGLKIDKAKLIKGLKYAGIAITGAGALAVTSVGFYKLNKKIEHERVTEEAKKLNSMNDAIWKDTKSDDD